MKTYRIFKRDTETPDFWHELAPLKVEHYIRAAEDIGNHGGPGEYMYWDVTDGINFQRIESITIVAVTKYEEFEPEDDPVYDAPLADDFSVKA